MFQAKAGANSKIIATQKTLQDKAGANSKIINRMKAIKMTFD
ncbi:hypothetical protein SAMN05444143_10590 [Flavobacterium succinicans]|jgi:hypothetical protein|uniref:Uncharacterized protein n=1 Tax=Flavobacterium succinicans TaxID=29536 RepID=A0A1I4VPU0_9FLAO|nr:hypothetical protein [Flavobacterium succinicans]SFN02976.1 hypothetical protein SAMN05444143_10590 [Flavobacterium succinicans]